MRKLKVSKIWIPAFLLAVVMAGCGDPDKSTGGATSPLTLPTVSVTLPNGLCPNNAVITATFSKAMNPMTISAATFTLTSSGGTVSGTVSLNSAGLVATFTPFTPPGLAASTTYTATITTGAQDTFGNTLVANFVSTFTTSATCQPPTVLSVLPSNGSTGNCPNVVATAVFSHAMNPTTINNTTFTLTAPSGSVTGVVTYDTTTNTATFTPASPPGLAVSTTYTATITTGAQDTFGIPLAGDKVWSFMTAAAGCGANPPPVPLLTAGNFKVLAGSTVTNTGPTTITGGNLGLSPGTSVTGFPPGTLIPPAVMHVTDPTAAQAQVDLTAAYNFAAAIVSPAPQVLAGNLTGMTLTAGTYKTSSSTGITTGSVTLTGNASSVFVFQIGSTLITGTGTQVILSGGVVASNVFWQVGSSATLGVGSSFAGTIMALTSITVDTGASLQGRALARNGAVTLDSNVITDP